MGVDTDAVADRAGRRARSDRARPEVLRPVLGVDPALHGVAGDDDVVLSQPKWQPFGHGELLGDQVEPGDHLGDRVLDLDAGVHLQEVEGPPLPVVEQFDRAQAAVAQVFCKRQRRRAISAWTSSGMSGAGASSNSFW